MDTTQINPANFKARIVGKFPQGVANDGRKYQEIPDEELTRMIVSKFPEGVTNDGIKYADFLKGGATYKRENFETEATKANKKSSIQADLEKYNKESELANSQIGFNRNVGKGLVENLFGSEVGLGKTIAKTFGNQSSQYSDAIGTLNNAQVQLSQLIRKNKAEGKDTSKLEGMYAENIKQLRGLGADLNEATTLPTTGQVAGQLGGTALDLITAGTYSKAAQGLKSGKLASNPSVIKTATGIVPELAPVARQETSGILTRKGLGNIATGAGVGYASDVSMGLQGMRGEDRTGNKAFIPGFGTALGTAIPAIAETRQSFSNLKSGEASANIMQRVARISKGKQEKFKQTAGESIGEYLTKRNIFGKPEEISNQLYKRFTDSKQTADDALATLDGVFKPKPVETALNELAEREARVSAPGALSPDLQRVFELRNKMANEGLNMSEINEVKRLYEKNVRLDFVKQNLPEGVARSTNIDNAVRAWQFETADKLGLKNLPEINRETRLARQLMDEIGKEYAGSAGNNAITLTDWIMISGGDPTAITGFLAKKTFGSKTVQSYIAKKMAPKASVGVPKATFGGKRGLPAKIEGVDYSTTKQNNPLYQTINLPESISKYNLGTDSTIQFNQSTKQVKPQVSEIMQKKSYNDNITPKSSVDNLNSGQETYTEQGIRELKEAGKNILEYLKKPKIGLSIQDVSKNIPANDRKVIVKFLDYATDSKVEMSNAEHNALETIAQGMGISMDEGVSKVATKLRDIMEGGQHFPKNERVLKSTFGKRS